MNPGEHQGRLRIADCRLWIFRFGEASELRDVSCRINLHFAEMFALWIGPQHQCGERALPPMCGEGGVEVSVRDDLAIDDDEGFTFQEQAHAIKRAGGAQYLRLLNRVNNPRSVARAVANLFAH